MASKSLKLESDPIDVKAATLCKAEEGLLSGKAQDAVAHVTDLAPDVHSGKVHDIVDQVAGLAIHVPAEQTFDTFTLFSELPIELRRKIWKEAAKFPRLLPLLETAQMIHECDWETVAFMVLQKSKNPQSAVLQVCRESREESMKFFELIFGTQLHLSQSPFVGPEFKFLTQTPTVYFNSYSDTLYLSTRFCGEFNPYVGMIYNGHRYGTHIRSLRSIAFDIDNFEVDSVFWHSVAEFLEYHRNVQEVILVVTQGVPAVLAKGPLELVEIGCKALRSRASKAIEELDGAFGVVESGVRSSAKVKYLMKHRSPFPNQGQLGFFEAVCLMMSAEKVEKPNEEALQKYAEECKYQRPVVKVMGLAKGGVRL